MRKFVLAAAGMSALLTLDLAVPPPAAAGPLPTTASVQPGAAPLEAFESVACYGFGWRGWGLYPGWFRPACAGAYVAPGYVMPAPVYAAPAYVPAPHPAVNRCWVAPGPDGRPGYWAAC